jgi:hypothetical protein
MAISRVFARVMMPPASVASSHTGSYFNHLIEAMKYAFGTAKTENGVGGLL